MEVMHFVTPEGFIFSIKLFVIKCSLMSAKPRCMLRQKPYCKTLDCTSPFAGLNSQLIALIYINVTTGGKDEPNIVFMQKSQRTSQHRTQNVKTPHKIKKMSNRDHDHMHGG
jgi:hypothetical protein